MIAKQVWKLDFDLEKMMRNTILYAVLFLSLNSVSGQDQFEWSVLLLGKGENLEIRDEMASMSKTGFYLYRNCIYDIEIKNLGHYSGRLVDIREDTLLFTNYFNSSIAHACNKKLDTVSIHYSALDRLLLINDRSKKTYSTYSFENFSFNFKKDSNKYILPSDWVRVYSNYSKEYELVPHLTSQGITTLFEDQGKLYFFYGTGMTRLDRSKIDSDYNKKNFIWVTPCKVEKINGLAIGLHTKNIKNQLFDERDTLIINGLNFEINPFEVFTLMKPKFSGPNQDSISHYNKYLKDDWRTKVNGVNVSILNNICEMQMRGVNLTALITVVDELHGISISGLNNFSYKMSGISIAGIRNRSTSSRGVQIALLNSSSDHRGFQFGIWNVNGKRSLPIINWQFKD